MLLSVPIYTPPSPNRKTTTTLFDWGYSEHLKKEKIQSSLTIKTLELITGAQLGSYNLKSTYLIWYVLPAKCPAQYPDFQNLKKL